MSDYEGWADGKSSAFLQFQEWLESVWRQE